MRSILWVTVSIAAAGCGLGITGEESGGAENLPTLGAGPYRRVQPVVETPADEPVVLGAIRSSFEDPSALARAGGGFRLWFGFTDLSAADPASEIWYAEIPSVHDVPSVGPEPAFAASDAWEQGRVAAPNVVDLGGGALALFYEAGDPADPAIGRADSDDDGRTWRKHPSNPVLTGAGSPTAVLLDGQWTLFATVPGVDGIYRADSDDGVAWELTPGPEIWPRPATDGAFDRFGLGDPFAVAFRSEADQIFYGVFFNGADGPNEDSDVAVGYAGSFDADRWLRYGGLEPVLITREVPVEGPTVVLEPTRATMFVSEVSAGRGKILAATHP